MSLFLVQHGKSLPKDMDPEKGLSAEGRDEVERIAALARGYGVNVSSIRHSGKKRARETAEIFAGALDPKNGIQQMDGLAPLDDVTKLDLRPEDNTMLVGHLPFMEKLATFLVTGSADRPSVLKFQNGGIVCVERDADTKNWFVKWTILPRID